MYFSTQQLVTMFKLQAKANSVMSDSWLTSSNDGDEINNEEEIPMDIIKQYYEGTFFVDDDFFCNIHD